jgi:hypothetical protein
LLKSRKRDLERMPRTQKKSLQPSMPGDLLVSQPFCLGERKLIISDNGYLVKSAGYDPDRPWDKEEALFAEAKRDMDRIKAEDRGAIFDEYGNLVGEAVGEADEGSQMGDGDETMLDAIDEEGEREDEDEEVQGDERGGDDEQAGEDEGQEELEVGVPGAEDEEGGNEIANENENEALFLPGAQTP